MPYAILPESAIAAMPRFSGSAVKVLVAVASFMPGRGLEGCYPSLAAIGERAGIQREKTITAAIKELVAAGILTCVRRKRQTNLLRWAVLEPAISAGTEILDPAVSAQVYPAVSVPRKETSEGNKTTVPAKKTRNTKPKANQSPTWLLWLRVNQDAGQPPPLEEQASLAAARKLAEQIPDPDEQEAIMRAYIGDRGDKWAISQGLTLAVLVHSRLSKCRTAAARAIEEQAAEDAVLIAEAEREYPDADERAAFFWARNEKGLRVPPGVDCRPLPGEKEAVF